MSLDQFRDVYVGGQDKLYVASVAATPSWQEIPVESITEAHEETMTDITSSAHYVSSVQYGATVKTAIQPIYDVKTHKIRTTGATPALATGLSTIMTAGEAVGVSAQVMLKIVPAGETGTTGTYTISQLRRLGTNPREGCGLSFRATCNGSVSAVS